MESRALVRRRTRLSPQARRQQLMECAINVFARRGIGRAGHAEIAEQAQVSVATVFNYFNTREDLVNAVLNEVETYFSNLTKVAFAQPVPLSLAAKNYVQSLTDAAFDQADVMHIWLEWSSSVREDVWPRFVATQEEHTALLVRRIDEAKRAGELVEGLDSHAQARVLLGLGYLTLQAVNQPNSPSREDVSTFLFNYINTVLQA